MSKLSLDAENDNPAIQKLNTIFDTLFGKRSKLQAKTYTEGVTHPMIQRQYFTPPPDISVYKQRIENELERAVKEYKNTLKPINRRILPSKVHSNKQQQRYMHMQYQKQEQKNMDFGKFSNGNSKNKYRRRACPTLKLH